ncbi:MAG TPA: exonuclease domain-containing protein [Candidatus Omnitrophota bacterium]|nr:exonuclease domain-containing protein [Candidatus Omnitrophota bacterium]HPD84483.1 exonuclease domain-containing protein [Candidatus Omnitrophota bacterium]HRZ03341.1 exonuclease domain-containing protein [Candidatus Omnitrophota bacterium]
MKNFERTEFVIFDVETTGLSPERGDRVVEIAALKVKNSKALGTFHSLVDPEREISFGAFEVNGISAEMLEGAPKSGEILPDFLKFIDGAVLVGHNVSFDLGFLREELSLNGLSLNSKIPVADTLKMARGLMPNLGRYPLWFVAQSLGIEMRQQHRAMADVYLTYEIFCRLAILAEQKGINDTQTFVQLFSDAQYADTDSRRAKVSLIAEVITKKEQLNLVYFSTNSAAATERKVTPKKLVFQGEKVKLVGFCHLRNEEREFRLDRILRVDRA